MVDSEQQPFSPAQQREEKRNILPMAIGAVVVAVIIAVLIFATRAGKSTGGNPADPNFGKPPANGKMRPRNIRIDHTSFGIQPFDPDAVKEALEKRGLNAQADTGNTGDIHQTAYKSYHTRTPNGYNLQISNITKDTRLIASSNLKPKQ